MQKKIIYLNIALSCLPFLEVSAEPIKDAITLTPSVGIYLHDSARELKNKPLYNLALGYNFNSMYSIEYVVGYLKTKHRYITNTRSNVSYFDSSHWMLNAYVHLANYRHSRWSPFLVAGAGYNTYDKVNHIRKSNLAKQLGIGAVYAVTNRIGLKTSINYIRSNSGQKAYNDYLFNFGAVIQFAPTIIKKSPEVKTAAEPLDDSYITDNKEEQLQMPELVNINFNFDETLVQESERQKLDKIGLLLSDSLNLRLCIEGYTDSAGTHKYNSRLSTRRAQEVADYLSNQYNIAQSRIDVIGKGTGNFDLDVLDAKRRLVTLRLIDISEDTSYIKH